MCEILDRYEPRALYFCDPEYFDKEDEQNYMHFNICKSYPNVLVRNQQLIPVYTKHDNKEEFKHICDLEKTGEFYIDEVVLDKYGYDLKIEAKFYSSNLVKYLVYVLKMDPSNIKYKLITCKALKPDTFKSFIEYVFDNFVGDVGTKYNKINHGFTCRDYETVMNICT